MSLVGTLLRARRIFYYERRARRRARVRIRGEKGSKCDHGVLLKGRKPCDVRYRQSHSAHFTRWSPQTQSPDPGRIEQPLPTMARTRRLVGGWLHKLDENLHIARTTGQHGKKEGVGGQKNRSPIIALQVGYDFLWRRFPGSLFPFPFSQGRPMDGEMARDGYGDAVVSSFSFSQAGLGWAGQAGWACCFWLGLPKGHEKEAVGLHRKAFALALNRRDPQSWPRHWRIRPRPLTNRFRRNGHQRPTLIPAYWVERCLPRSATYYYSPVWGRQRYGRVQKLALVGSKLAS